MRKAREVRPRAEAEKTLDEIQFSRKTKLGHGLVGLDAKGVSRGLIWEFYRARIRAEGRNPEETRICHDRS